MVNITVDEIAPVEPDYRVTLELTHTEADLLRTWLGRTSPHARFEALGFVVVDPHRFPSDHPDYDKFAPLLSHDGLFGELHTALNRVL